MRAAFHSSSDFWSGTSVGCVLPPPPPKKSATLSKKPMAATVLGRVIRLRWGAKAATVGSRSDAVSAEAFMAATLTPTTLTPRC